MTRIILEIPCEFLIKRLCGSQWRNLPNREQDAAWGMAIVYAVLNGCRPDLASVSRYLKVPKHVVYNAFKRLELNGVFLNNRINKDRAELKRNDVLAWGYYGGYASGATGPVTVQ